MRSILFKEFLEQACGSVFQVFSTRESKKVSRLAGFSGSKHYSAFYSTTAYILENLSIYSV